MVVIQLVTSIFQYFSMHNLYLSHFYFVLQFLLLSCFYLELVPSVFQKNAIKILVPACLTTLAVQYYLDHELFFKFNLFEIFITSFLLIIFAMFHLYAILNEQKRYYYLTIGVFVYLFGSTLLFISGNLFNKLDTNLRNILWILNSLLYGVYQVYIFLEFKFIILNKKGQK